ncbi:MAG: O-antigen ligase family protein [Gemmatimonadales bacterium]|nr:O-antigen ligase family protein [Gemmatimonadales bacterium]
MSQRFETPIRTGTALQAGLLLLVASIPFEYPERTIPLEIPTLTGAVFLLVTLFYPSRCYGRIPGPALGFAVYLAASLFTIMLGSGEHTSEAVSEFIVVLQGVLVFLAAANVMRDVSVARRALMTLAAACSLRAALPFLGLGRTTDAVWTGGERVSALGQNANSAAMIMAAGLVALIGLVFLIRHRTTFSLVLGGLLSALLALAILETGSRGGLLALLGGVLVFALAANSWQQRVRNGTIALLAISLLTAAALSRPVMKNRLVDTATTGNLAGREQLYPALWSMFLEKPLLGWGPVANGYELAARVGERDRASRAAHNVVLELITAGGLLTALPFIVGVWLSVQRAWRARAGEHGVLPLALFSSVFLSNMSGDWGASKLLWLVLAYCLASGQWRATARCPAPVRSRRWVMTSLSGVRN